MEYNPLARVDSLRWLDQDIANLHIQFLEIKDIFLALHAFLVGHVT